jgi:hypothetical protein
VGRAASGLYQDGRLQLRVVDTNDVGSAQAWGPCPRCGHALDMQVTLRIATAGLRSD